MPPRKSNVSTVNAQDDDSPAPTTQAQTSNSRESKDDTLGVEDLNLPKSIVQRLAKGVLPANTQIQKDALLAMSKSATVFVNYLTSQYVALPFPLELTMALQNLLETHVEAEVLCANCLVSCSAAEHALRSGKKTVMPKDVFDAMNELEFSFMIPRLEAEVAKFTSIQADKRNTYRKKVRDEKKGGGGPGEANGVGGDGESTLLSVGEGESMALDQDGERASKRAKMEGGVGAESEGEDGEEEGDEVDEEVEDDEIEEDEEEGPGEGMTEDLLEEKEEKDEDDEMGDGDESD